MKTLIVSLAAVFLAGSAFLVSAADDEAAESLMKKSGCFKCHSVDKKKDGPAYKDVAAKYKNDSEAAAKLTLKVRGGGSGSFGSTPMLATPKSVSDDTIKTIVAWILTL